jgi:hypothetical protein
MTPSLAATLRTTTKVVATERPRTCSGNCQGAKVKAASVYKGRPASIDAAQVRAMRAHGPGGVRDREGPRSAVRQA